MQKWKSAVNTPHSPHISLQGIQTKKVLLDPLSWFSFTMGIVLSASPPRPSSTLPCKVLLKVKKQVRVHFA